MTTSRLFTSWLADMGISLAFTSYHVGKLFLVGLQPNGKLSVFERSLDRCMALHASGEKLLVSTLYQNWLFRNILETGQQTDGYDRVYLPQVGYVTGDLDTHDIALDANERIVFVNTLFSCLATVSQNHSFVPFWKPPFVSKLAAEDRCHLNGLAMGEKGPQYVTAVSETDIADGWRQHREKGGVVVDVEQNESVVWELSMPHSPRIHDGKLWLHQSGTGFFGFADPQSGKFEPVTFCPGFLRGLSFIGNFAVMGLSHARERQSFGGLQLDENLTKHKVAPQCGINVVDLRSGDVVHWLRMEGVVREVFDVAVLSGVRRPMMIGFQSAEIRRVISIGQPHAP